jgi:hypothetical protein
MTTRARTDRQFIRNRRGYPSEHEGNMKCGGTHYHLPTVRTIPLFVATIIVLSLTAGSAQDAPRSFDQDAVGAAPPGFSFAVARIPAGGRWQVRADNGNRVLAHLPDAAAGEGFAIALLDAVATGDLRLSARVRLEDGVRTGGLVWRYTGPDNFYAAALDLDAQAIALYRISRGNRIRLEFEDDLELDRSAWHTLRVEHTDGRIRVSLGGIGVMRARARDTDAAEGRAGVWSAGNAAAAFDDVSVGPPERDRRR